MEQEKKKPTLGDLPTKESCVKLLHVSFSDPKKSLAVYRFCNKAGELLDFKQAEVNKLIHQYGEPTDKDGVFNIPKDKIQAYNEAVRKLSETDIEEDVILGLTEDDFSECHYPKDENLWLSGGEIMTFLKF